MKNLLCVTLLLSSALLGLPVFFPSSAREQPVTALPAIAPPTVQPARPAPQPVTRIEVDLSDRRLILIAAGQVQAFPVAIGSPATPTPTGRFRVLQMQKNPIYQNPFTGKVYDGGDDSPIGNRWIAFEPGMINGSEVWYGIHGTSEPDSIGKSISTGCIRMRADDLLTVYDAVKLGSEILIRE